jgi:hypothetical protein
VYAFTGETARDGKTKVERGCVGLNKGVIPQRVTLQGGTREPWAMRVVIAHGIRTTATD